MRIFDLDTTADTQRRTDHREAYVCLEARIKRVRHSPYASVSLTEPFGLLLAREIRAIYNADLKDKDNRPIKHLQMFAALVSSFNLMQRMVAELSLIYRKSPEIKGVLAGSQAWQRLSKEISFEEVLRTKLQYTIALEAAVVRPKLIPRKSRYQDGITRYYPVGLAALPPHLITIVPYPHNPLKPMIVIEHADDSSAVSVCDLSDPEYPRWGGWKSLQAWGSYYTNAYGAPPEWSMDGDAYPWIKAGKPIMPYVAFRGFAASTSILPIPEGRVADTVHIILERTRLQRATMLRPMPIPLTLTDAELEGWEMLNPDLDYINSLHGGGQGQKKLEAIPSATEDVIKLEQRLTGLIGEIMSRHNTSLQVQRTVAESGLALTIREGGLFRTRAEQVRLNEGGDSQILDAYVATHNYAVESGGLVDELLPEGENTLYYPMAWSAEHFRQAKAELREAVKLGLASPVDEYLLERELQDTPENRARAMAELERGQVERLYLVERGYGVSAEVLHASIGLAGQQPEEDAVWTAPREVAQEAAAGASLFDRYNKPGTPAADRRGSPSAKRMAGRLKRGDALNQGDLIDIVTFTTQARDVGEGQPGWDDDSDPSTQWIDFRCYGGEPGNVWANGELDKLDGQPGGNEDQDVVAESEAV